ncbi:ABC transporter ATP-binding protein [bacterium]|nr:ABC transporter ATP-binding protein [bacterium]
MLDIENLSVNYGYVSALRGVDLHVGQGEIITLIGGNGAGKTTTLMSISNLIEKAEGRITFKGKDITGMAPHRIVKMGICHVPEGRRIFPSLSVRENLVAGTVGNTALKKADQARRFEEVYALFPRLRERMQQNGGSLSGGEQQMLAIARGLMMDPDLIMLDEPSLGLAPIIVEEIFELILKIKQKGKTILLIEQNAGMALQVADRGYVLVTGQITLGGTGKELLVNPEVRRAYLGM